MSKQKHKRCQINVRADINLVIATCVENRSDTRLCERHELAIAAFAARRITISYTEGAGSVWSK